MRRKYLLLAAVTVVLTGCGTAAGQPARLSDAEVVFCDAVVANDDMPLGLGSRTFDRVATQLAVPKAYKNFSGDDQWSWNTREGLDQPASFPDYQRVCRALYEAANGS